MNVSKIVAALLFAASVPAFAQTASAPAPKDPTATPGIDKRQAVQQGRISKGIASGQLTAKEASGLETREAKIQSDKTAAKADGKVTAAERRKLKREQNRASAKIAEKKHNAKTAPPAVTK